MMKSKIKHLIRRENSGISAIVSSCYPGGGDFQAQQLSLENVSIHSTNALHAPNECRHTASVPQVSISVQNVSGTIWHVLKTIFQHRAEFSHSKTQKNGMPMTIINHNLMDQLKVIRSSICTGVH